MVSGILAHLGKRISKQHELLATEGLTYLLERSGACRDVVRNLASASGITLPANIQYRSEVTGEDADRPDIVGFDRVHREVCIIEGKFFAGLTDNQPNTYLIRLLKSQTGMLLFVVPRLRVESLWAELRLRATQHGIPIGAPQTRHGKHYHCSVGEKHVLMITSWPELLADMHRDAHTDPIASDIRQLRDLCEMVEGEEFVPFSAEELTSLAHPRRHYDLYSLVNAITNRLSKSGRISVDGMRATPDREGYFRYVWLGGKQNLGSGLIGLNYLAWRETGLGPLWLGYHIASADEKLERDFHKLAVQCGVASPMYEDGYYAYVPLPLKPNREHNQIVEETATFIETFLAVYQA